MTDLRFGAAEAGRRRRLHDSVQLDDVLAMLFWAPDTDWQRGSIYLHGSSATPALAIRLTECPDQVISRKVTVRTRGGDKIAGKRVDGKCKNGVVRYKFTFHPNVELRVNTVIQSFWSHLPDEDRAPKVKLKLEF